MVHWAMADTGARFALFVLYDDPAREYADRRMQPVPTARHSDLRRMGGPKVQ